MATPSNRQGAAQFAADGEMGARIAAHDWSASPLGPVERWPVALINAVSLMLLAQAEIVIFWGPEYIALYNDAYMPTIGDKHPAALGQPARGPWSELWDDLRPLLEHVRTTGETYAAKSRPFYIERAGYGEEVYFDISYSAVRLADGSVGGVLCIVSETTERVRAARAIAQDRARMTEMFDQAPGFMALLAGPSYIFELANQTYRALIGDDRGELIGRPLLDVLPELKGQGYIELLDEVVRSGRPYRADGARVQVRRAPDAPLTELVVDFVFQPITDAEGRVTGVFMQGIDVTPRYAAEEALRRSRESLAMAVEAAAIGTWDLDLSTDRLIWSDRTKMLFGVPPDAPVSMLDFWAAVHPEDHQSVAEAFAASLDPIKRADYDVEYRVVLPLDGRLCWIAARGSGVFEDGRCIRAVGTVIDITARKLHQERLRESEARFRALADSLPALVWVSDQRGDVLFAGHGFQTMLGIPPGEVVDGGWKRLIPPEHHAAFDASRAQRLTRPSTYSGDLRVRDLEGKARWVHAEVRPRMVAGVFEGYVGCAVDVTETHMAGEALERRVVERTAELSGEIAERERVEATLHQMQRLEAVGQLTAGVAHDFNNLLTVVLGNVPLIERAVRGSDHDPRTLRRLESVRTAAERGATLTAQLLAFSRRQRLEAKVVDLNETVAGMLDLMRSTLGGSVTIVTRPYRALWPALVDPTQIELIILNLAINARDAMANAGTLTLETSNVSLGAPIRTEEPPAGDYVRIAVIDTGTGMTEEVLAKAFEPFFTTKDVGKGSGLGLAQVFGFAKQSGGGVRIDTALGAGTTVSVYLPRAEQVAEVTSQAIEPCAGSVAGRTVLVLDDDDAVRSVTADGLRDAGCRVIEAADGESALEAIAAESAVDLVVADFAMPGMNGARFSEEAKARWPALPVVFLTGYADLAAIADVPDDRILQKPFASDAVTAMVRRVLDGG